ncbi:MAG TPA: hemolysin family protein [Mycobacteriales bacterium]|nr:hemolysin family protein [Mycobacteriales bacterium]
MSDLVAILLGVLLLALNAFFVGAEFALISARRTQIEPRAAAGSRVARTTLKAMENVSLMMAGAQLGITVCSLALGAIAKPAVKHLLAPLFGAVGMPETVQDVASFVVAMAIVVVLHVVLGEMVPKNIALARPERAALALGPPLVFVVALLKPFIVVLNMVSNGILRLFRVQPKGEVTSTFTREEVAGLVEESRREGLLDADEYDLLSGALGFQERTVERVLLPHAGLATVARGATVVEVEERCAATGYSRFPVRDAGGDLIGYLHVKDVLESDPERRLRPVADKWIRPLATVRRGDRLHDALEVMQARGAHMARVADSDGTVHGVVALEDVLEELVGEIRDATQAPQTR